MTTETIDAPLLTRDANDGVHIRAQSYDDETNSVELIWTTGAKVRRYDWRDGGYFDEELVVQPGNVRLERLNAGAPFLDTHDSYELSRVIGSIVPGSVRLEGGKGYARAMLSRRPDVAGVVQDIRDGVIRFVSVGYRIHKVDKTEGADGDVALWRVVDWEPLEISAVPIPADPGAQMRSQEAAGKRATNTCVVHRADATPATDAADAEHHEESAMADANAAAAPSGNETTTTEVRAAAPAAPVAQPVAAAPAPDADAIRAAERERAATISELGDKHGHRKLADAAIRNGTSLDDFRASLLAEIGKKEGPSIQSSARVEGPAGGAQRGEAIVNALLHRFDMQKYQLDAAARDFRGMSLIDIARDCLEAHGRSTRGMSRQEIAAEALAAGQRAGGMHSTSDFPFVLANVANKTLRAAYEQSPQTFRPFTRITSVPDFKAVSRVQLGEAPALERVNEHGEFERGTIAEGREQYAIATYGKVVGITRQVIINDDLSAFTRVPQAFGFQAANLESDLVWAQIVSNPVMGDGQTLFHSTHGNVMTPGGINADNVAAGFELMRLQKGLDGRTLLNIMPSFILAPVATQMRLSQFLGSISPSQTSNVVPEYIRTVTPIIEPRLDGGFTNPATGAAVAGSRFNWFLAAAPGMVDTVELAYLEGNQGVYTETRTGFDVDGVEVKVRLDAGSKVIDWRAFARNLATGL